MKIRDIRIDGFGRFSDAKFGPLERPVTVFFGPNEAGKSTLLEFVRRMLFGFPRKSGRVNPFPALRGGRYGGRIAIEGLDGRMFDLHRTKGGSFRGDVVLTSASGQPLSGNELTALLGNHSRDVFEQVFAFTLEDLYSDDLLNDENVNSQIYSAGMGVTLLPSAFKSIESDRTDIFLRGGSSQRVYEVHSKIEELDETLQRVRDNAARYGELTGCRRQVESELKILAVRQQEIQSRYNHQVMLQNAWGGWIDLNSAEEDLADLPAIDDFPADGLNRLEALQERVSAAQREYESAGQRAAEAERAADVTIEHEGILASSAEVRRLQEGRTAFDGSVKDLPERETELEGHTRTLADTLKNLGPDWDERRLEAFDLSIAVRQQISEHGDRLRIASAELAEVKSALDQDRASLEEARDAKSNARQGLEAADRPRLDSDQIRQHRHLVRTARSQLDEISRLRQNVLNLKNQLKGVEGVAPAKGVRAGSRTVAAISFGIGIALLVAGAILGGTAAIIGAAAGIALAGLGIYLFMSANPHPLLAGESPLARPIRESIRDAEQDIEDRRIKMEQDATPLNLEVIDESSLLAAEQTTDEEEDLVVERTRLTETLKGAKELVRQRQVRTDKTAAAVEDAEGRLSAARLEWREWAMSRGLSDTFTPETADVLQGQVELGRSRLDDVRSWQQRIKAIQRNIDEYIAAVEPLAAAFDVPCDRNDPRIVAAAADRLVELMDEVQENVRNRTAAEAEMKDAKRQLNDRKCDLQQAEEELEQLLGSGGAEDVETFRERAGVFDRRTKLDDNARAAHDRLRRLSGPGERLETLKSDLQKTNPESIADEIAALENQRDSTDAQRDMRSAEQGEIRKELAGLVGEEESSRLRMEKNVLLEQFQGHARDWTRLTIARNLLEESRRKFERERQPGVIRHAERFFTSITDGRYRQVYAPLGERTITVTDADGRTKQPSELSRGTREQLFLSLRFGLIRELGERTEPLPVVVDEVLVNFDPDRALRAAAAFTELSKSNQVLVFTCHPTVVELFRNAASESGVAKPEVVRIT